MWHLPLEVGLNQGEELGPASKDIKQSECNAVESEMGAVRWDPK